MKTTKKTKKAKKTAGQEPVIITTDKRGVFFGYVASAAAVPMGEAAEVTLANARMCVRWSETIGGVLGLGANGPNPQCRIGPAVPSIRLRGIHAVISVTADAATAWESAPWAQ